MNESTNSFFQRHEKEHVVISTSNRKCQCQWQRPSIGGLQDQQLALMRSGHHQIILVGSIYGSRSDRPICNVWIFLVENMTASPTLPFTTTVDQSLNTPILLVGGKTRDSSSLMTDSECVQHFGFKDPKQCPEIEVQEPIWNAAGNVIIKDGQHCPIVCGGKKLGNKRSDQYVSL